jgi:ABC-type amino acid transport system permease subunit
MRQRDVKNRTFRSTPGVVAVLALVFFVSAGTETAHAAVLYVGHGVAHAPAAYWMDVVRAKLLSVV